MIIEGYAALFGVEDCARDIVRAGAFAASLARRAGPLPMLVEHEPKLLAGFWQLALEDKRGLFLRGAIDERQRGAGHAKRALMRGADGLSIGFVAVAEYRAGVNRILTEIELLEVSIVAHPMQPQARLALAREFVRAA
jgi:HK97 family phage prohead protease